MKYQFTKNTIEKKKLETLLELKRFHKKVLEVSDNVSKECFEKSPLLEKLLELQRDYFDREMIIETFDRYFIPYEAWRKVYVKNGWKEVKNYGIVPDDDDEIVRLFFKDADKEILKKYSAFEKTIDGDLYRQTLKKDHDIIHEKSDWELNSEISSSRINRIKKASNDLNFLGRHERIYDHEALLIMLGISPVDIPRTEILRWQIGPHWFDKDHSFDNVVLNLKIGYEDFEEWEWISREFIANKNLTPITRISDLSPLNDDPGRADATQSVMKYRNTYEINTKQFIEWAMKLGIIENKGEAPFEREFSELLYKELKDRLLITGDYNEKWQWQSHSNSLNYLIRLLWINRLPREWYAKNPKQTNKTRRPDKVWHREEGAMFYFFYNDKTEIRLQRAQGEVDKEFEILSTVEALLDHVNDPQEMKII